MTFFVTIPSTQIHSSLILVRALSVLTLISPLGLSNELLDGAEQALELNSKLTRSGAFSFSFELLDSRFYEKYTREPASAISATNPAEAMINRILSFLVSLVSTSRRR